MTVYRIRFEGPAALVTEVATALADAEGVELTASKPPSIAGDSMVALDVTVEGTHDEVTSAVAGISRSLPDGASIVIEND